MLGTLVAALEVRGIVVPPGAVSAEVTGENALEAGIPMLRRVLVRYALDLPGADPAYRAGAGDPRGQVSDGPHAEGQRGGRVGGGARRRRVDSARVNR